MERKTPHAFEIYRHFKGELYQIITVATHTETGEDMIVYQALYGDYKCYVRPLSMFMEEVDCVKYPHVAQVYRFELYDKSNTINEVNATETLPQEEKIDASTSGINPEFLRFLDAKTYHEKMLLLRKMQNQMDDRLINNLAMSLDLSVEEGTIEDRFYSLVNGLSLLEKFECNRLR